MAELSLECLALPLRLGDPLRGDLDGVLVVEQGAVFGELAVAFSDAGAQLRLAGDGFVVGLGRPGKRCARLVDVVVVKQRRQAGVEAGDHGVFLDVDAPGVGVVADGVVGAEAAPVVGAVVVPLSLHAAPADPAVQDPREDVLAAGGGRAAHRPLAAVELRLSRPELIPVHEWLVPGLGRPDPLGGVVPAHLGLMSERDVVDVDQHLVLALLVPDLEACVAGVDEDGAHRRLRPQSSAGGTVAVTLGVVAGRRRDAVVIEALGDGVQPDPAAVVGKDSLYDRCGDRVGHQPAQPLTDGGLGGVGVRAGVGEHVAVRRTATEESALDRRLGGHGGPDPRPDPHSLALAHPAVEAHHEIVGLGARVYGAADLRHPELDAIVHEHRERETELVAVERPLGLADDDRVEAALGPAERVEQPRRLRAPLPRKRAGLPDVEELGNDPAVGLDDLAGAGELPVARRSWVLLILGADSPVEREPLHPVTRLEATPPRLGHRSPHAPGGQRPSGGCAATPPQHRARATAAIMARGSTGDVTRPARASILMRCERLVHTLFGLQRGKAVAKSSRILFTCRPLSGHFEPLLPLAVAARSAGHSVAFASGEPVVARAAEAGFVVFEAGPSESFRAEWAPRFPWFHTLVGDAQRRFFLTEIFANLELAPRAVDLETIMSTWLPDLVVHEMAEFAAPMIATALGIPYADVGYGALIPHDLLISAGAATAVHWSARGLEPHPLGGAFRHLYVDPCPPALQNPEIADIAAVQPMRPAAGEPQTAKRSEVFDLLPPGPVVYVTLGTIWNTDLDVFRMMIDALHDHVNVIVTVGHQNDPAALCDQPHNVIVRRYIPQHALLPWCNAIVAHGGSGTVLGALAHGVPLLVVPQGADQWGNAVHVVDAGAGRRLLRDELSPAAVHDAVTELLTDPSYRRAASKISDEIAAMPSATDAVAALEALI